MARHKLSEAQEDYLKHILKLSEFNQQVSTQSLAKELDVKPASVTGMLKKLSELNLVRYKPYKGVELTETGSKIALEILRHHRLLEVYLADVLNYTWDEIHEEAEKLEHVISEKFEARIAEKLGHPTHDPHGDPIPDIDLQYPYEPELQPLYSLQPEQSGIIKRVITQDSDALHLLTRLGLKIDTYIQVTEKAYEAVRVKVHDERFLLPNSLARQLLVLKSE